MMEDRIMFSKKDKKSRFLKRLSRLEVVNQDEVISLLKSGNNTQAFLTQWMAVEKTAKHIAKVGSICGWCEKAFESLNKSLGDIGFSQESLEKKIFDTLYTRYSEARTSGFDTININHLMSALVVLGVNKNDHELTVLLASKPDKNSQNKDWPKGRKQTIRKIRNGLIHADGRISREDYNDYSPYFEKYFLIISDVASQVELLEEAVKS